MERYIIIPKNATTDDIRRAIVAATAVHTNEGPDGLVGTGIAAAATTAAIAPPIPKPTPGYCICGRRISLNKSRCLACNPITKANS